MRLQNRDNRLLTSSCLSLSFFCMSVRPHGTSPLSLDGFPFSLIFQHFSKIYWQNSSFINSYKYNGYFTWTPKYSYDNISLNCSYNKKCFWKMLYRESKYTFYSWIKIDKLMSLGLFYFLFNVFRMLVHSSSGACDCVWVYCSGSMCVGVTVWFGWGGVVSPTHIEPE